MSEEPGFLTKSAQAFIKKSPPPTGEERMRYIYALRRIEADAFEAANVVRRAPKIEREGEG